MNWDIIILYMILGFVASVSVIMYLKLNTPRKRFITILGIFSILVVRIFLSLAIEILNVKGLQATISMDITLVTVFLIMVPIWVIDTTLSYTWHNIITPKELLKISCWIDKYRPSTDFLDLSGYFISVLLIVVSFAKMIKMF